MQILQAGDVGEEVAQLQRMLAAYAKASPNIYKPVVVNGIYDAATVTAMKALQKSWGQNQTGNWNKYTQAKAVEVARYLTKGKSGNPFAPYPNTLGNDRAYIVGEYNRLYGHPPTEADITRDADRLQRGWTRTALMAVMEKREAPAAITKMFKELMGREPTAAEMATWSKKFADGTATRKSARQWLASQPEALTFTPPTEPSAEQEDARAQMNQMLDELGLGGLKDWAWEQIKQGRKGPRLLQEMRQTEEYKVRFAGNTRRVAEGLPAMGEDEYLLFEEQAEQVMRSSGMPAVFQNRDAYADLIAGNVSIAELSERVQNGYVRVNTAPTEVRDRFAQWFGAAGDAALAAFFLSKDRALPALREHIAMAEIGGIGDQFGIDFTYDRAQDIAQAGIDGDNARQGIAQIQQLDPLFRETISEEDDLTAIDEGADAVFQLGGTGLTELERRGRERVAATSGGGGAAIGSKGTGAGTSE